MQAATAETFGDLLKYLRRRARLTQRELAQAVGYTEAHICRLEKNQRPPDLTTIAALFGPALDLEDDAATMARLLEFAAAAREDRTVTRISYTATSIREEVIEELGTLEDIPALPSHYVARPALQKHLIGTLQRDRQVMISGLPGMGKTTLAGSIAHDLARMQPVFWLTFRRGISTTFDVIVRQVALFLLAHGQTELRELARPESSAPLPPDRQLTLISAALQQRPALLCFDEVQTVSGDETVLELFRHLRATPAQVLCMGREAALLPDTPTLHLTGLEPAEARQLIERLDFNLTPTLMERVLDKTARSPMLLRLTAGQLQDRSVNATRFVDHLDMQPQVAGYLVETVLHDLSPAARALAELVAVFRHPIDLYDDTLIELWTKAVKIQRIDRALAELQRRHLIEYPREAALHPLVRDHLYTALATDPARKKQLHLVAAAWIERCSGDVLDAAYHYVRAGRVLQVTHVIADQSEALFNRGQASAAAEVIDEALVLARKQSKLSPDVLRQLLTARGDVLKSTPRAAEAEASYREALALAHGHPVARATIVRVLAQSLMQRGQTAEALRLCQSAIAGLSPNDVILRARLLAVQCRAHLAVSQYDDAELTAREALALTTHFAEYLPQVADDVTARAERTLGWINYTRHPQGEESIMHYRRGLAAARRSGVRVVEAALLSNLGTALLERGDWSGSLEAYQASYAAFESFGDVYSMAGVLHNLSEVHHKRNELVETLHYLDQACEMERRVGDHEGLLISGSGRASILLDMGRLSEARAAIDEVVTGFTDSGDTWTLGSCLIIQAEIQMLLHQLAESQATLDRVLNMPGVRENARIYAWLQSVIVLRHIAAGDVVAAQASATPHPPADIGLELGFRWQMVDCLLALASGKVVEARAQLGLIAQNNQSSGHVLNATAAERLLAHSAVPVPDLPRLLYLPQQPI